MSAGLLAALLLSAGAAQPAPAPAATGGATAEVRAAVDGFVRAFEALDWPAFSGLLLVAAVQGADGRGGNLIGRVCLPAD